MKPLSNMVGWISALVQSRDLGKNPTVRKLKEANFYFAIESGLALLVSFLINLAIVVCFGQGN
jgi:natural resistance-associated macrophage protein